VGSYFLFVKHSPLLHRDNPEMPTASHSQGNGPEPRRDNPFQEEEEQGNEQKREAPGVDREYEDNEPEERRAPGEGQEDPDRDQDSDRRIA
jgi:hypothetical protein